MSFSTERFSHIYVQEIVSMHRLPISIIPDKVSMFIYSFQRTFQKELGTQVGLDTAFHPHTNGQLERTIQILKDTLHIYVMDFRGQ